MVSQVLYHSNLYLHSDLHTSTLQDISDTLRIQSFYFDRSIRSKLMVGVKRFFSYLKERSAMTSIVVDSVFKNRDESLRPKKTHHSKLFNFA